MSEDEFNKGSEQDPVETERITSKELAKLRRKKAYQAAKERQKTDPKYLAMKEKAKAERRAAYQRQKEFFKNKKSVEKKREQQRKSEEKDRQAKELFELLQESKLKQPPKLRLVTNNVNDGQ